MRPLLLLTLTACAESAQCPSGPPTVHDATGTLSEEGLAAAQHEARLHDARTQRPACITAIGWRRPEVYIDRREGEPTVRFDVAERERSGEIDHVCVQGARRTRRA
jgi:hypothetical protein